MNPFFWTDFFIDVLLVVYVLDCLFMGLVIMMQRSKQEGLGAAFGGGMTESLWGAQTSQVLVKATVYAAIIFFVLSITLARLYAHRASISHESSPVQQLLSAPVKSTAPAIPAALLTNSTSAVVPTATPVAAPQPSAHAVANPVPPSSNAAPAKAAAPSK